MLNVSQKYSPKIRFLRTRDCSAREPPYFLPDGSGGGIGISLRLPREQISSSRLKLTMSPADRIPTDQGQDDRSIRHNQTTSQSSPVEDFLAIGPAALRILLTKRQFGLVRQPHSLEQIDSKATEHQRLEYLSILKFVEFGVLNVFMFCRRSEKAGVSLSSEQRSGRSGRLDSGSTNRRTRIRSICAEGEGIR